MTRRPRSVVLAFATAATLALGATGCGTDSTSADDPDPTTASSPPSDAPEPTEATDSPTAPETSASANADPVASTVPVYFVGDTPQGPRLYREFRQVETDNPLEEAAALMTAGDALDPDYRTAFPGGTFESVTYDAALGEFHAVVGDDGWQTPVDQASSEEAELAAQQLVHTLQGVQQQRGKVKVFTTDGAPAGPLFGIDTSRGLSRAPQLDILALVNVTAPEEGATVSGSFVANGVGSSFEATIGWEITDASGAVVLDGFATAKGWMDRLYPWRTKVDVSSLAPGDYTFVARTDDPSGGEEGFGPTQDTRKITVE